MVLQVSEHLIGGGDKTLPSPQTRTIAIKDINNGAVGSPEALRPTMHFTFPSIVVLVGAVACNLAAAIDPSVVRNTCEAIASSVSSKSAVYYVGKIIARLSLSGCRLLASFLGDEYQNDIYHWAVSSTQLAVCSFEPATAQDVGIAVSSRKSYLLVVILQNYYGSSKS